MNEQVRTWLRRHSAKLTGYVLEVGARNVNGGIRDIANVAVGIDISPGRGVDCVLSAEKLPECFPAEEFDAVVCCETMEHVEHWREALAGMWYVLRNGGWLIVTVPTQRKPRHNYPSDYWRWTPEDVAKIWPDAEVDQTWSAGIGWVAQKSGPLPDLSEIELWAVP